MEPFRRRLLKIQKELKAPKSQTNSFGNYKYRSCEDILEAVKPLAAENGILLTVSDDIEVRGDRYYIKATATAWDVESPEKQECFAFAREPAAKKGMDESQVTGASSSYARKYALNGLLCIDDTKDSDYAPQASGNTTNQPVCYRCKKKITDVEYQGKKYSAKNIMETSEKKFSQRLCWDCYCKKSNGQ